MAGLLGEVFPDGFVGLPGVGQGLVQASGVDLLVHLKGLAQQPEGLAHALVLLLKAGDLLAGELVDGGVHHHYVLVQPLGEGLEAVDLALHLLEVQGGDGRASSGGMETDLSRSTFLEGVVAVT